MDPLSISAAVAGLVTLAGTVFSLAANYIKDAKEAPKEAKDLLDEVKQFSVLLHHLSLVARELEIAIKPGEEALQDSPNLQWHHIYDCQTILNRVETGLQRATDNLVSPSTFIKTRSRLKWPFSSDSTKEMIQTIQRYKQTINVALSANSYSRLAICLSRQEAAGKLQEDTNKRLASVQVTVDEILKINTKVTLDEKRREVLSLFNQFANPSQDFETAQRLRHPSTGLWFINSDDFKEWRATPGSRLWITGIPGAGKSVLAGLSIYECLKLSSEDVRKATTYFFCTYRNKATHSVRNVLSSLTAQLARQNEEAFRILEEYYQELISQKNLATEPSLQKLLKVFETMCQLFDQVFVVVDGLDECETDEVVCNLSQLSLKMNSASITTLLLSRDEVHIRDQLESHFNHNDIEAHTEDIQLYVLSELEKRIGSRKLRLRNPQLKAEILDGLVRGAKGMFRWVACQLDYLGELPTDREKRNALSKLPPTLPATYERILMKVEQSGEEVRRLVQRTLLLIHASLCDVGYLCEALATRDDSNVLTEEDTVDEYEIMLGCSSLIRKSVDGKRLEFSHFTVQEFLEGIDPVNASLWLYNISRTKAETTMVQICLRYLMLEDFQKDTRADIEYIQYIQDRTKTRPFYRFCAWRWVACVRALVNENPDRNDTDIDTRTSELIQTLFKPQKTYGFCQWVIDFVDSSTYKRTYYIALEKYVPLIPLRPFNFGENTRVSADHVTIRTDSPSPEEQQAFIRFIAAIIRPDFTPLHMASVLGLPSLCDRLLKGGAKVNLTSRFGTPLHCALGGINIFLRESALASRPIASIPTPTVTTPLAQSQTVRLLLAAGAHATTRLSTPFQQRSLMGTMHISPLYLSTFELFPDLIQAGLNIEEGDAESMEKFLKHNIELRKGIPPTAIVAMLKVMLNCLKSASNSNHGPTQRLYSVLYRVARSQDVRLVGLVPEDIYNRPASISNRLSILRSLIRNNDIIALERMVDENPPELFKNARFNIGGEEWTAVHLACDSSSSDTLRLLLKIGTDPEVGTHLGTKPIHLAHARQDGGETLKALLQHQVCTTAAMGSLGTIWHLTIQNDDMQALRLLISLASDMDEALQVTSGSNQTAISMALDEQNGDAVMLLLEHCHTASFWESNTPLYRQAARLGSLEVVKKLLDMGIQLDDLDDELGSVLHDTSPAASVACVELLIEIFPHRHRRRKDGQTPFQCCLKQAVNKYNDRKSVKIEPRVLEALLPAFETPQTEDMVEQMVVTWPFFCSTVIEYIPKTTRDINWIKEIFTHMLDIDLTRCFEERHETSALVLFATELGRVCSNLLPAWLAIRQGKPWETSKLKLVENWEVLSYMIQELFSKIAFEGSVTEHHSVTRLLSYAILHDDRNLMEQLLHSGVAPHRRVDSLSPLEAACLPVVDISEDTFKCLLSYVKAERLDEHNQHCDGFTPTHLVAIRTDFQERSLWKLEQILKAGANANAITSTSWCIPAIKIHIWWGHVATVQVLLRAGADPWLTDIDGINAALQATARNNISLLEMIAEYSTSGGLEAKWNQTWKSSEHGVSGGNALHLAAWHGCEDCMQMYLHKKWLEDLESVDDELQTPMHYAALGGRAATIRFLYDRGCDINRTAKNGKSPLRLAIERGHPSTVKLLLELGAEVKVDANGVSPLACAYRTGNFELINILRGRTRDDRIMPLQLSPKDIRKMADAFSIALRKGDLDVCERFITQGLPIDSEMCDPWPVTPLMLALYEHMPSQTVEWLITKGAKVSVTFEGPNMLEHDTDTALGAAIAKRDYNPLLPTLLRHYVGEGGDFSRLRQTPLHTAVWRDNHEGLTILLNELHQLPCDVEDVVNQKDGLRYNRAALHWAAEKNSVDSAKILISNGADLELTDNRGFTPLHIAAIYGSIDVLKLLISQGAHPEPPCLINRQTPLMYACSRGHVKVAEYLLQLERKIVEDINDNDAVHLTLLIAPPSEVEICAMLFPMGFDLHRANKFGLCAIFDVMASPTHGILRYLLREYPLSLRIQDIQWSSEQPWYEYTSKPNRVSNITGGYRLVRRYLGRGEPLKVSGSVFVGKRSLLYLAASGGLVGAVDDLLSIGIDPDVKVCDEGTTLTIAAAHGQLAVVKYLVRRAAKLFYQSGDSQESAFASIATYKKEVLQWLLVDRYTEQPKIASARTDVDREDRQAKEWTGVTPIRLSLKWEWTQRRRESMLEYARRLQQIRRELRGQVVSPVVETEMEGATKEQMNIQMKR
ncbi:ankyrin repeat-containing domain protein [Nemania sp. FL0031]|nr:ankyrin repeat-containing domain protein [Nemania sp. FL0031]